MVKLLLKFWPVFIPLILYVVWLLWAKRRARAQGTQAPTFFSGPWWWAVIATLLLGIGLFIYLGLSAENTQGDYAPAHMEDGVLVPGTVTP